MPHRDGASARYRRAGWAGDTDAEEPLGWLINRVERHELAPDAFRRCMNHHGSRDLVERRFRRRGALGLDEAGRKDCDHHQRRGSLMRGARNALDEIAHRPAHGS